MTERLYLQDPRRKTAHAVISGHAAGGFLLDRTVFHASSPEYRHGQPCDLGHVLCEGHKLKLDKVRWDRGRLIHVTSGPLPKVGEKAVLHLDAPRRDLQARAHAAMHLVAAAALDLHGTLLDVPSVVGGGEVRVHARFREAPGVALPKVVARAQAWIDQRLPVAHGWAARDDAARRVTHHLLALDAVAPQEPTLRLVRIGEGVVLPCDAPLPEHAWEIGRLKLTMAQPKAQGVRFGVKVVAP